MTTQSGSEHAKPRLWVVIGAVGVALGIGVGIGTMLNLPNDPQTTAPPPVTQYGAGQLVVGQDIPTGIYRTNGPAQPGVLCSATVNHNADMLPPGDTTVSHTMMNDGSPTSMYVVTLTARDTVFQSNGCTPWSRVGDAQ